MTRERIEDMRDVVLPFVTKRLKETNYEGLGESDSKEFTKDFNEILNLAIKALNNKENIDKMKEEICKLQTYLLHSGDTKKVDLQDALDIINKYCKGDKDGSNNN